MKINRFDLNYDTSTIRNILTTKYLLLEQTYQLFPGLNSKDGIPTREQIKYALKKYYAQNRENYYWAFVKFEKAWQPKEKIISDTMITEMNLNQATSPEKWAKQVNCYISLAPGASRGLQEKMIGIFYKFKTNYKIAVCVHELLHLAFYLKFQELFPGRKIEDFEYPHVIWQLSELAVVPLINQTKLHEIVGIKETAHNAFKEAMWSKNISYAEHFSNLFEVFKNEDKIFDAYLKQAYAEIADRALSEEKLSSS